jgi:ABC-type nickel/cobalt efflux system permease component RcnA
LQWGRWNLSAASRWLTRIAYLIVVFFYGWLFVAIFAGQQADAVKRGGGHR